MTTKTRGESYLRTATILAGLVLPSLTLLPLGSLWLWQNGFLLHWAVSAAVLVTLAYVLQRNLIGRPHAAGSADEDGDPELTSAETSPDPDWTPAERQAWAGVLQIGKSIDVAKLTSREAILILGTDTVEAVANRLHPEVGDPIWQFTVPEAFAILERVARRLGDFTTDNIPLSDRLTVAQVLKLYRWRGALEWGGKALVVGAASTATPNLAGRLTGRGQTAMQ